MGERVADWTLHRIIDESHALIAWCEYELDTTGVPVERVEALQEVIASRKERIRAMEDLLKERPEDRRKEQLYLLSRIGLITLLLLMFLIALTLIGFIALYRLGV